MRTLPGQRGCCRHERTFFEDIGVRRLGVFGKHAACGQRQSEIGVQPQSRIEPFWCARLRAKDAIDSPLILFCSFETAGREGFAGARVNRVGSLNSRF